MFKQRIGANPLLFILLAAGVLRIVCAMTNVGVMAIDDYVYMLKLAFPAQNLMSVSEVLASTWVHPPLPMLTLTRVSQLPLMLGLTESMRQIQFVYALMGVFNLISVYAAYRCFELFGRKREAVIAGCLVGFHCVMPFFSTRVLFETFSMPVIILGLYYFLKFTKNHRKSDLFISLLVIVFACLLRFQSGVVYIALGCWLLRKEYRKYLAVFFLFSGIFFFASGAIDLLFGRGFHESVIGYVKYNIAHSSDYGTSGPFNYLLLFLGLSLPPLFIRNWKGFSWRTQYRDFLPALLVFFLFLLLHSMVPHKEDRFMIPIVPVFLLLLVPLINQLIKEQRFLRLKVFAGLNLIILILASFFTAQQNVIGVAQHLDKHQEIRSLVNYHGSLVFVPTAYMNRPNLTVKNIAHHEATETEVVGGCDQLVAVRQDILADFEKSDWPLVRVSSSEPGPIEWLVVRLNRKRNGRRDTIHLYQRKNCQIGHASI